MFIFCFMKPAEYFEVVSKRVDKYNSELRLDVKNPLNYDEYSIHLFQLEAVNVEKMAGTATVVVEVAPVRPPKWNQIFATKTFDEKSPQVIILWIRFNRLTSLKQMICISSIEINLKINIFKRHLDDFVNRIFNLFQKKIYIMPYF